MRDKERDEVLQALKEKFPDRLPRAARAVPRDRAGRGEAGHRLRPRTPNNDEERRRAGGVTRSRVFELLSPSEDLRPPRSSCVRLAAWHGRRRHARRRHRPARAPPWCKASPKGKLEIVPPRRSARDPDDGSRRARDAPQATTGRRRNAFNLYMHNGDQRPRHGERRGRRADASTAKFVKAACDVPLEPRFKRRPLRPRRRAAPAGQSTRPRSSAMLRVKTRTCGSDRASRGQVPFHARSGRASSPRSAKSISARMRLRATQRDSRRAEGLRVRARAAKKTTAEPTGDP